jgi:hypothetical protein
LLYTTAVGPLALPETLNITVAGHTLGTWRLRPVPGPTMPHPETGERLIATVDLSWRDQARAAWRVALASLRRALRQ